MENFSFQQIKNGDRKVFEQVFKTYYAALCRFGCSYLSDMEQAEDLVQEVFVKLWEKRESTNIETSLQAYLFQAVKNSCFNQLKHQKVKEQHRAYQLQNADQVTQSEVIEADELQQQIQALIHQLPEKRQQIFRLSREEGLKYSEIAERINVSVKTVETQMSFALKFLRENLRHFSLWAILLWDQIKEFL